MRANYSNHKINIRFVADDFGERFVPGYKRASTVDYLLNSPFRE